MKFRGIVLAVAVGGALVAAAPPALAGQVINDGFESGLSGWTVTTGGDGTFAVQGAEVATGSGAARWSISANTGSLAYARRSVGTALTDLTVNWAGRIDTEGASGSNVPFVRLLSPTGARTLFVYRQNVSSNKLYVSYAGGFFQTTGTLALGVFARFSLHVIVNGAASTVTLAKDGATIYSTTTASLGTDPIQTVQLGNETAKQIGVAVIDDFSVFDANGSDTSITGGPSGPTSSPAPSFTFTSPDATATFQCNLDGGAYAACTSPKAYSGLADGAHTFNVRAVDTAGNVDPTPATRAFTVDTVAPDTSIDSAPTGTVTSTSASIGFSSPDATATFQCQLDGGAFAACTSPKTYSGLADGAHAVAVRAVDPAGNLDPSPATASWTVSSGSATPPDTSILTGPSGTVASSTASFTFTSTDGSATFQCQLDGGAFASCTSPTTYSGLADGAHAFAVRASNAAGTDSSPAAQGWTVDTTAPDTSISSGPSDPSSSASATFVFTSTEPGSTFTCSLDGTPVACTSPKSYSGLANGSHTFAVAATDAVGNVDVTPASQTWTVNVQSASPPDTFINSGPNGPTTSTSASFTFSASDGSTSFACKLDGGSSAACTSPASYSGLADGLHTFSVQASNAAGPDPTPATQSWTVDTSAPDVAISGGPAAGTTVTQTSASFGFSSTDNTATFVCSLDGVTFAACAPPATYSSLADGPHTFQVKAVDPLGNTSAAASRTWTVDTVAPTTVIDSGPTGTQTVATATFTFHSADATATFACRLDAGSFAPCSSPYTLTNLANGTHVLTIKATDPAGNGEVAPPSQTWTVTVASGTPPNTTITGGPSGLVNSSTATFTFTSDDNTASFECSLDGALFSSCATPKTYTGLAQGAHTVQVRAVNAAGTDATPATQSFTVDTVAPTITASTPANGNNDVPSSSAVTATFSEPMDATTISTSTFTVSQGGAPVAAIVSFDPATRTATLTPTSFFAPGTTFTARVKGGSGGVADVAGNALAADVTWTFTTPAVLVGAGDISDCNGGAQSTTATLLDGIPGLVFAAGDEAYPNGAAADFANCYDPAWGRHKPRTIPALGNHELLTPDATGYFGYFGAAAGDPSLGYYSTNVGAWHVVVLDSNCTVVSCEAGSAQETWLRQDLAASTAACTIAIWHHPRFSSGAIGPNPAVSPLFQALYDYGADVVLNGHDHVYERFAPQSPTAVADAFGIREFIVGTGGATLNGKGTTAANSQAFQNKWHGVLKLTLHPTGYDWQWIGEPGSTFTDAGTGQCHGTAGAPPPPPSPSTSFSDGFESGNLSAWTAVHTGAGGTATVQTGTVKTGTYAISLTASGTSTANAYVRKTLTPEQPDVTASLDARISAQGGTGGDVPIFRLFDTYNQRIVYLYRTNGTNNQVWLRWGSSYFKTSALLPLNTWAHFDLHVIVRSGATSTIEVKKDGVLVYSTTVATIGSLPVATVQVGNDSVSQAFGLFADNVSIHPGA